VIELQIINEETVLTDIRQLKPHPKNPNQGNTDLIAESIHENGFYGAIIAQRSSGHILVGHHRLKAAEQLGAKEVPVTWVDVDNARALKIMLADNRTAELARRDDEKLAELLSELQLESGLEGTGYIDADLIRLTSLLSADLPQSFRELDETLNTAHNGKTCPHCGETL